MGGACGRLDGGRQYFTRAKDFGYSKTAEETLRIWDRQAVLGDIVRVIREFRPDVIITRFPPDSTAGHGHHTSSALLAEEAFAAAADPKTCPHCKTHFEVELKFCGECGKSMKAVQG